MERPPILQPRGPAAGGTSPAASTTPTSGPPEAGTTKSSSDVKPLEGKTTIDEKLSIECEILCYRAISKIAEQIGKDFHDYHSKVPSKDTPVCIIFLDETFKAALQLQQAVVFQFELLKRGFEQLLPVKAKEAREEPIRKEFITLVPEMAAVTGGIAAATTLGKSVIDLLALFRTDVSYAGRSVTIKEAPLVLDLAQKLQKDNWTFLYPRLLLYPPSLTTQVSAKHIENLLTDLFDKRERAGDVICNFAADVAKNESALADLVAQALEKHKHHDHSLDDEIANRKQALIPPRLELDGKRAQFEALDTKLKRLQVSLITPDEKSGVVPLHLVQQAEEVLARFGDTKKDTYFLWAEVSTANGSYRIRRNLWQTLFSRDDGLSYSGGVIVTYAFFDCNANVVLSGIHRYREPFTQFCVTVGGEKEGNSF